MARKKSTHVSCIAEPQTALVVDSEGPPSHPICSSLETKQYHMEPQSNGVNTAVDKPPSKRKSSLLLNGDEQAGSSSKAASSIATLSGTALAAGEAVLAETGPNINGHHDTHESTIKHKILGKTDAFHDAGQAPREADDSASAHGSESSLSELGESDQNDIDSDECGDDIEHMPFAYIRHKFDSYPLVDSNDASDAEGDHTVKFPALTPLQDFMDSLEDIADLPYNEAYARLENAVESGLKMLQEEHMLNDLQIKHLEREHPIPEDERAAIFKSYKNPRAKPRFDFQPKAADDHRTQEEARAAAAFRHVQQSQDLLESMNYGYEYNPAYQLVGQQAILKQKLAADGRRTLRQAVPSQKMMDGDATTDPESDETGATGRPIRKTRGTPTVGSRFNSEAPDEASIKAAPTFASGKRKGRPPGVNRIAQLKQDREGAVALPEQRRPRQDHNRDHNILPTTEVDDQDLPGSSSVVESDADEEIQSDFGISAKKLGAKQVLKKRKKVITAKRQQVRDIQLKPVEERTDEEAKIYKNFREKKGAWATRNNRDPEIVLARFDRNALWDTGDEEEESDRDASSRGRIAQSSDVRSDNKSSEPAPSIGKASRVKKLAKDDKGPSPASLNMKRRWKLKKEAQERGEDPPPIGRYPNKDKEKQARAKGSMTETQILPASSHPAAVSGTSSFKIYGYARRPNDMPEIPPASFYGSPANFMAPSVPMQGTFRPGGTKMRLNEPVNPHLSPYVPAALTQQAPKARGGRAKKAEEQQQPPPLAPPPPHYQPEFHQPYPGSNMMMDSAPFPVMPMLNAPHQVAPAYGRPAYTSPYAQPPVFQSYQPEPRVVMEEPVAAPKKAQKGGRQKKAVASSTEPEVETVSFGAPRTIAAPPDAIAPPPAKKSRKGIGGRPRKNPLPTAPASMQDEKQHAQKSTEAAAKNGRKPRRTASNNKLSSMTVTDSDDEAAGALPELRDAVAEKPLLNEPAPNGTRKSGRARKPTPAAIEAGIDFDPRPTTSSSTSQDELHGSTPMAPPSAKRTRKPTAKAQVPSQLDGAFDDDIANDADHSQLNTFTSSAARSRKRKSMNESVFDDTMDVPDTNSSTKRRRIGSRSSLTHPTIPSLPRKVSEYEEYLALSSPTVNTNAKRRKRTAALKARRSFNVDDEGTPEDEDIDMMDSPEPAVKEETSSVPEAQARNVGSGFLSQQPKLTEYERYQALASPDGSEHLGKRKRKSVVDMRVILAAERAGDV